MLAVDLSRALVDELLHEFEYLFELGHLLLQLLFQLLLRQRSRRTRHVRLVCTRRPNERRQVLRGQARGIHKPNVKLHGHHLEEHGLSARVLVQPEGVIQVLPQVHEEFVLSGYLGMKLQVIRHLREVVTQPVIIYSLAYGRPPEMKVAGLLGAYVVPHLGSPRAALQKYALNQI